MENETFCPSRADRLYLAAAAAVLAATCVVTSAMAAPEAAPQQVDTPTVVEVPVEAAEAMALVEVVLPPAAEADPYREDIPLDRELQAVLREACDAHGVPLCLALGLIEVESGFQADADNGVSVGLMQLNRRYFPDDLTPEENIQAGVAHLGGLLERCEDTQQALTFYNVGHDNGSRRYARAALAAAEKWGDG